MTVYSLFVFSQQIFFSWPLTSPPKYYCIALVFAPNSAGWLYCTVSIQQSFLWHRQNHQRVTTFLWFSFLGHCRHKNMFGELSALLFTLCQALALGNFSTLSDLSLGKRVAHRRPRQGRGLVGPVSGLGIPLSFDRLGSASEANPVAIRRWSVGEEEGWKNNGWAWI